MSNLAKKSGFRIGVQIFMVLLVLGIFVAACGTDADPFAGITKHCTDSAYPYYCSNNDYCCGSQYSCVGASGCYASIPNTTTCSNAGGTGQYEICYVE
jgi:hypothetical protein